MGCVDESQNNDILIPMNWGISRETGLIQLTSVVPLKDLYEKSHGSGEVGKLWNNHHETFASFISKFSPSSVLEIGGAHGILAEKYFSLNEISWSIIEPNPRPINKCRAKFIKGFFDKDLKLNNEIDTIIHSHVLEHIYYPEEFMNDISNYLKKGNKLIFHYPIWNKCSKITIQIVLTLNMVFF